MYDGQPRCVMMSMIGENLSTAKGSLNQLVLLITFITMVCLSEVDKRVELFALVVQKICITYEADTS